jgi:hypothetical protein
MQPDRTHASTGGLASENLAAKPRAWILASVRDRLVRLLPLLLDATAHHGLVGFVAGDAAADRAKHGVMNDVAGDGARRRAGEAADGLGGRRRCDEAHGESGG